MISRENHWRRNLLIFCVSKSWFYLFIYLYFEYQKQKFWKILKLKFLHDKHRLRERKQRATDHPTADQVKVLAAGVREHQSRGTNGLRCQEFCEKQALSNGLRQLYSEEEWNVQKTLRIWDQRGFVLVDQIRTSGASTGTLYKNQWPWIIWLPLACPSLKCLQGNKDFFTSQ